MCGRYAITQPPSVLAKLYKAIGALPNFPARYNAAPTQPLPIVRRAHSDQRELALARWGLVPSWSKGPDPRFTMINARSETVSSKPAYRGPFRHRRCLVPASGFFEWQTIPGGKQPWYFTSASGEPLAFAGLWDQWMGPQGDEIESFTIVLTDANETVRPVHERMPVILAPDDYGKWLGEEDLPTRQVEQLLRPFPASEMKAWPVSIRVNSAANDDPAVLDEWSEIVRPDQMELLHQGDVDQWR
ncbi:MAG: putative SOS response-associated peptidase YedK [Alphaproteobacteria bacterium]|jgi:putative SOS response-associated peptidase YedK